MTLSENAIQAGGLGDLFKNLSKEEVNISKKLAKNVLSNPTRAIAIARYCYRSCK